MSASAAPERLFCPQLFDGRALRRGVTLHLGQGGRIAGIEDGRHADAADLPPGGHTVAPGLVDIQVNGGGGVLFNDAADARSIAAIAAAHLARGTTSLLPTLITDTFDNMRRTLEAAAAARAADSGILGVHIEGPFINKIRKGAHRADLIRAINPEDMRLLRDAAQTTRILLTLAPECVPAGTIRTLTDAGVRVFAGHTGATAAEMRAARAEGLCGVTHLFNAMSQILPREAGCAGAALADASLYAGIILDGHHVARDTFDILRKARGTERLILVSDAMPPAGARMESFVLQGETIRVTGGACVNASGALAGAAICLSDAVRIGVVDYGLKLEEALRAATSTPAEMLGLSGEIGVLAPGARADCVILDAALRPRRVIKGGRIVDNTF